ncbi:MAG: HEAT repeat domain-containing protein [Planctomycetes bacterium]|nr:HEAT repeat domain-containing protein [Planctomycetota bacterium]
MPRLRFIIGIVVMLVPAAVPGQENKKQASPFKRLDKHPAEELRKQLFLVPEAGFDQSGAKVAHEYVTKGKMVPADVGQRFLAQFALRFRRTDWLELPWRNGLDSQIGKDQAERLHVFSTKLRSTMMASVPTEDVRPDADKLRTSLSDTKPGSLAWDKSEAVPTLAQMLQVESEPLRKLMVEKLAQIEGKESSAVIAQRAVFDLSPEIRQQAIRALASRPKKEYRQVILDAFRWPWQPAAEHAAEAVAALKWKELTPELIGLLKEPDPKLPFGDGVVYLREMVRINHLCNCFLCHAPSLAKEDLVRGLAPVPGQSISPPYYGGTGTAVRADITFLRQDFSVFQPVANPDKWPGFQRYDYLLRTRKANRKEIDLLRSVQKNPTKSYPQRDAVLFAIRELTGVDRGTRTEDWLPFLKGVSEKKSSSSERP